MTLKSVVILSICLTCFAIDGYGQKIAKLITKSPVNKTPVIKLTSSLDRLAMPIQKDSNFVISQRSVFDVQKLPIFCKIEHKLAKSSKINVMMRLGSLDYVNRLEGKN